MARRKPKYPIRPHRMRPEIRDRFLALMAPVVREREEKRIGLLPAPRWQLWRWDTLEDVRFD